MSRFGLIHLAKSRTRERFDYLDAEEKITRWPVAISLSGPSPRVWSSEHIVAKLDEWVLVIAAQ